MRLLYAVSKSVSLLLAQSGFCNVTVFSISWQRNIWTEVTAGSQDKSGARWQEGETASMGKRLTARAWP